MNVGLLLAAGEGSRLTPLGVPKFFLPVAGKPLFSRALENLYTLGARKVIIGLPSRLRPAIESLVNRQSETLCSDLFSSADIFFHYVDTPSSVHTLHEVFRQFLKSRGPKNGVEESQFLVSLIDSIVRPEDLRRFRQQIEKHPGSNILLVSRFVDDEKPLLVNAAPLGGGWMQVEKIGSDLVGAIGATAGVYVFQEAMLSRLEPFLQQGGVKLRNFLSKNQDSFFAWLTEKVVDVDRPEDVCIAEGFISGTN